MTQTSSLEVKSMHVKCCKWAVNCIGCFWKLYNQRWSCWVCIIIFAKKKKRKDEISVYNPCSYDCCFRSSQKSLKSSGINETRTLTSVMLVQCYTSWVIQPTGSYLLCGSMMSSYSTWWMPTYVITWIYLKFIYLNSRFKQIFSVWSSKLLLLK